MNIAGAEAASVGRYVYVPEEWQRQQRASATRNSMLRILAAVVFAGLLVASALVGMMAWSRGHYAPRLFVAGAAMLLGASIVKAANGWPEVMARLTTAAPLRLQIAGVVALGLVSALLSAALVGLALGSVPRRLTASGKMEERGAAQLGVAAGLFVSAFGAVAWAVRTPCGPGCPTWPEREPFSRHCTPRSTRFRGSWCSSPVALSALLLIDRLTASWTRRHSAGIVALAIVGFLGGGVPAGGGLGGWAAGGVLMAGGVVFVYVTLLRLDLTIVPIGLATIAAVRALASGSGRPYPGALAGAMAAAILAMGLGWWWFRALRQERARAAGLARTAFTAAPPD